MSIEAGILVVIALLLGVVIAVLVTIEHDRWVDREREKVREYLTGLSKKR